MKENDKRRYAAPRIITVMLGTEAPLLAASPKIVIKGAGYRDIKFDYKYFEKNPDEIDAEANGDAWQDEE